MARPGNTYLRHACGNMDEVIHTAATWKEN